VYEDTFFFVAEKNCVLPIFFVCAPGAQTKKIASSPSQRMGDGIADKVTQGAAGHGGAGAGAGARTAAEFRAGATHVATPWAGEAGGSVSARARVGTERRGRVTQEKGSCERKAPDRGRGRRGVRMNTRQQPGPGAGAGGKRGCGMAGVPVWTGGGCRRCAGEGMSMVSSCIGIVLQSTS
jgi:hypothetical protein